MSRKRSNKTKANVPLAVRQLGDYNGIGNKTSMENPSKRSSRPPSRLVEMDLPPPAAAAEKKKTTLTTSRSKKAVRPPSKSSSQEKRNKSSNASRTMPKRKRAKKQRSDGVPTAKVKGEEKKKKAESQDFPSSDSDSKQNSIKRMSKTMRMQLELKQRKHNEEVEKIRKRYNGQPEKLRRALRLASSSVCNGPIEDEIKARQKLDWLFGGSDEKIIGSTFEVPFPLAGIYQSDALSAWLKEKKRNARTKKKHPYTWILMDDPSLNDGDFRLTEAQWIVTPMIYFCSVGDLKMCRYLYVRGGRALCTRGNLSKAGEFQWETQLYPMLVAAYFGHLEVCRWLYEHGGKAARRDAVGGKKCRVDPFFAGLCSPANNRFAVCKFLILKGALSKGKSSRIFSNELLKDHGTRDLVDDCARIFAWAVDTVKSYDNFVETSYPDLRMLRVDPAVKELITEQDCSIIGMLRHLTVRLWRMFEKRGNEALLTTHVDIKMESLECLIGSYSCDCYYGCDPYDYRDSKKLHEYSSDDEYSIDDENSIGEPGAREDFEILESGTREECEIFARGELREKGFDPEKLNEEVEVHFEYDDELENRSLSPMLYYAEIGNLKMCRYLLSRGADCTLANHNEEEYVFPMLIAANRGKFHTCKWLYANGAADDIRRQDHDGMNAMHASLRHAIVKAKDLGEKPQLKLTKWLILKGALCLDDDPGKIDHDRMADDLTLCTDIDLIDARPLLLRWAQNMVQTHDAFLLFKKFSSSPDTPLKSLSREHHAKSSCLKMLNGKSELVQLIGDFVGFARGNELRIVRQLSTCLPSFIKNTPWITHPDSKQ